MPEPEQTLYDQIEGALAEDSQTEEILAIVGEEHPSDVAEALGWLEPDEAALIFGVLPEDQASEVLAECGEELVAHLTSETPIPRLSDILEEMDPDDAADVAGDFEDQQRLQLVLDLMEPEDRGEIEKLLVHDEESAGGIMTSELLAFPQALTVGSLIQILHRLQPEEHFAYGFTLDAGGRLAGVFPIQKLVWTQPDKRIEEIANPDVITVSEDIDQEEVARLFSKYDLYSIPVVDVDGRPTGRITVDDILDVVQEETSEDMFKLAGTGDELSTRSPWKILRLRAPWLLIALAGGIGCAFILRGFEAEIMQFTYLAFYFPVIMTMGGNIGNQSSTLMVRGLATGQLDTSHVLRTISREVRMGILLGLICGLVSGVFGFLYAQYLGQPGATGLIVGISMLASMTVSALFASLVPLSFFRLGVDPAVASAPLITMTNDAMGLALYLTFARMLSNLLV